MPILKPITAIQLNKSHPFARGLVGCWLFNEGTGGKVFDLTGYQNTGTLYNGVSWCPGKHGSALEFDGSDDYVRTVGANPIPSSGDFTIAGWIYCSGKGGTDSDKRMTPFGSATWVSPPGAIKGILLRRNPFTDNLEVGWGDGSTTDSKILIIDISSVNNGKWYHVAFTYDSANTTLNGYANGLIEGSGVSQAYADSGYDFHIGHSASLNPSEAYWNGRVGSVFIWNRVLTAVEIARLYQEPFCIFDMATKLGLLYPAGQIIWLTAASTATASVYGSLTKQSKLAGIIDAAAALSGILTWCYRGPVERQWLTEALFNGMTTNAFKLGTVLTGGWFWMRRTGCSVLYRGPSMERIDFANILAVAEQDAGSISPPDYIPHHSHSTYFYVVCRFNICGYQECTLTAAVKVAIDANGNLIEPKPNNIFVWRLDQVYGNKIQLIWFYCPLEQESKPESFRIYYDGGTGHIDYENPITTVNYQGRKFYTYQSDVLAAGRYLFAVRAEDAAGIENNSLAQLGIHLSTKSPDAINILSAEAV